MSLEPRNHGIVIATDHFVMMEGERYLLGEVLRDEKVRQHVNGLWVPRYVLDDHSRAAEISLLAMGVGLTDPPSHSKPTAEQPRLRLIFDTSSSGGSEDMFMHIEKISHAFPAPHMSFTVSLAAGEEGIIALQDEYKDREDVDLLLGGVYPEHLPEGIRRLTKMTEREYTEHISELANYYGLAGVVGFGGLAKYTKVGQYYLAMGVCGAEASAYTTKITNTEVEIKKRMTSPEDTYRYAENTEIILGRTLFTMAGGSLELPSKRTLSPEEYNALVPVVKGNLLDVAARLSALPPPMPLPETRT